MPTPLAHMLKQKSTLILDGAMGTELQRLGEKTGLPLWSASALLENPEAVLQIHTSYIEAGADIITTNTFRTTGRTFRRANLPDRSAALTALAVQLARCARDRYPDRQILIAGCIAPLEDCYRPDLVPARNELQREHAELAARLVAGGVDFLLLETMGTIREAVAACAIATATGKETIVSFLCGRTGDLYGGDSLEEAVLRLAPLHPTGYSVNCCSPKQLGAIIRRLRLVTDLPLAVYGNAGIPGQEQSGNLSVEISPGAYASFAGDWLAGGASIIGGCCGTTPEYIRMLPRRESTP